MIHSDDKHPMPVTDPGRVIHDPARLEAVRRSGLLDSAPEEVFDRLTRLATRVLNVPVSFLSVVDENRDFYKSQCGFGEQLASEREIRGTTFCHYTIPSDQPLVINDTRTHPLYRQVPTVESLGVAAYAGIPLITSEGHPIGSFCAVDFEPRDWTPMDVEVLSELAASAMREIELRAEIAERLQVEQERLVLLQESERRSREIERITESRARLVRGFSHDLKNPLGAADGHAALLADGILGELSQRQQHSVERIRASILSALGLINDLVELARAEAGQVEVHPAPTDVRAVVLEIAGEYRAQVETAGLSLHTQLPDHFPAVQSDPSRVRQILGNLISNAIKYNREKGQITVRVGLRHRDESSPERWIAVEVTDTGMGIPEDKQHLLFREFSRLEPGASHGAGLGLAISQKIAHALGGEISMHSRVEVGSTFCLWLPGRVEDRGIEE